jgi:hypothetical protein
MALHWFAVMNQKYEYKKTNVQSTLVFIFAPCVAAGKEQNL